MDTDASLEQTDELFDDIDFMEQPGETLSQATRTPTWVWAAAGAALGVGALYLTHPQHGERRRAGVRDGCRGFGKACGGGIMNQLRGWRDRLMATDFQTEIRNHAPQYLQ